MKLLQILLATAVLATPAFSAEVKHKGTKECNACCKKAEKCDSCCHDKGKGEECKECCFKK